MLGQFDIIQSVGEDFNKFSKITAVHSITTTNGYFSFHHINDSTEILNKCIDYGIYYLIYSLNVRVKQHNNNQPD